MPTSSNKNIDEIQQQLISSTTFLKDNFCLITACKITFFLVSISGYSFVLDGKTNEF